MTWQGLNPYVRTSVNVEGRTPRSGLPASPTRQAGVKGSAIAHELGEDGKQGMDLLRNEQQCARDPGFAMNNSAHTGFAMNSSALPLIHEEQEGASVTSNRSHTLIRNEQQSACMIRDDAPSFCWIMVNKTKHDSSWKLERRGTQEWWEGMTNSHFYIQTAGRSAAESLVSEKTELVDEAVIVEREDEDM